MMAREPSQALGPAGQKGPAVAYVLKYRTTDGRQRWQTIGRHGSPWTPDLARAEARRILGEVAKGADPAGAKQKGRRAETVAQLCEDYLEAAEAGRVLTRRKASKKPSTLATDKGRIERHIKPLLGNLKVSAVARADIERFRDAVTDGATKARVKTGKHGLARVVGGRGTATRTIGLLGAIFAFGVRRGLRSDNPVRGVERHADKLLAACQTQNMPRSAKPCGRCRRKHGRSRSARRNSLRSRVGGVARRSALAWAEVDLVTRTARLGATKTGASLRPLSRAACDVLRSLPRIGPLVFPSSS